MGEHIAHEVDAAALPSGVEHLGDGAFDALLAAVRIRAKMAKNLTLPLSGFCLSPM
jgi:hypothetical protein